MPEIAAIILAAGKSSRMKGGNKLMLPWKDKSMLEHVVQNIHEASPSAVVIVTNPVTHALASKIGFQTILNTHFEQGMTTSIQAGVKAIAHADAFMICPADLPMISAEEYRMVMDHFENSYKEDPKVIVVPFANGVKGHPVIFSAHYRDAILEHTDMEGCSGIVQDNKGHVVRLDMPSDHVIRDVDDRQNYDRYSQ